MATDERKRELWYLNRKAWDGNLDNPFGPTTKLDSSLKKNSSFIKKLKQSISKDNAASLIEAINTLSLEKYMAEIISAVSESLSKCVKTEDVVAAIEVMSALHSRFPHQLTPVVNAKILDAFQNPPSKNNQFFDQNIELGKEDLVRITTQKTYLRLLMEFHMVGLFTTFHQCSADELPSFLLQKLSRHELDFNEYVIVTIVKDVLHYEVKYGSNFSIVTSFVKRFGYLFSKQAVDKISQSHTEVDENNVSSAPSSVLDDTAEQLFDQFEWYATITAKYAVKVYYNIFQLKAKIKTVSIKTGRISSELNRRCELMEELFERYKNIHEVLKEVLLIDVLELPVLNEKEFMDAEAAADNIATGGSASGDEQKAQDLNTSENGVAIWENDEERKFYTELPDITQIFPAEVLQKDNDVNYVDNDKVTMGEKTTDFINRLTNCTSQREIDNLACEYWAEKLNNKASRNRLYKTFMENQENTRMKFYARFLAINKTSLLTVRDSLIEKLDKTFRFQIFSPAAMKMNVKNIYFFAELVKFNLVQLHVVFHKIRSLILGIKETNNVDLLNVLIDQCGRFLYYANGPESKKLMEEMMVLLQDKKKEDKSLSINDKMAIDNLLLIIVPASMKSLQDQHILLESKKTPEQTFIIQLLHKELSGNNWTEIALLIMKLDWKNKEEFEFVKSIMTQPEDLAYESLQYLARILYSLKVISETLYVYTFDTILEKIQRGLEVTDYKYNRIRMAQIKYLGELLVAGIDYKRGDELEKDVNLFFRTFSKLVVFGYPTIPTSNSFIEIDPPNNYFRINLILTLLETVKKSIIFPRSKSGLKAKNHGKHTFNVEFLNKFRGSLLLLNYYILIKRQPVPKDMNFKVVAFFNSIEKIYNYSCDLMEVSSALNEFLTNSRNTKEATVSHAADFVDNENAAVMGAENTQPESSFSEIAIEPTHKNTDDFDSQVEVQPSIEGKKNHGGADDNYEDEAEEDGENEENKDEEQEQEQDEDKEGEEGEGDYEDEDEDDEDEDNEDDEEAEKEEDDDDDEDEEDEVGDFSDYNLSDYDDEDDDENAEYDLLDKEFERRMREEEEAKSFEQKIEDELNRMILDGLESRKQQSQNAHSYAHSSPLSTSLHSQVSLQGLGKAQRRDLQTSSVLTSNSKESGVYNAYGSGGHTSLKHLNKVVNANTKENLPKYPGQFGGNNRNDEGAGTGDIGGDGNHKKIAFSLVTRSDKGKNLVKKINISSEEKIVAEKLAEQERKKQEQEKIKRIVLNSMTND